VIAEPRREMENFLFVSLLCFFNLENETKKCSQAHLLAKPPRSAK
jgi:hypothetical protein